MTDIDRVVYMCPICLLDVLLLEAKADVAGQTQYPGKAIFGSVTEKLASRYRDRKTDTTLPFNTGIGPSLHFYSLQECQKLRLSCVVLPSSSIHGIRHLQQEKEKYPRLSCCFGNKSARVWNYDCVQNRVSFMSVVCKCEDWIWDCCWLTNDQERPTLALALGHNTAVHWDWENSSVLRVVQCDVSCIIYCAHFIGQCWSDLVLATGTVFNEVVIWSVSTQDQEGKSPVLHRLQGHQGVIFAIDYNSELRRICSASDDRSIRVWQLSTPGETGSWAGAEFTLLQAMFGHSARVWSVCLLHNRLVSVGEDSTCCVWDYEGEVLHKYKGHMGKSIWSLAVNKKGTLVATGGGDHSVRVWTLQQDCLPHKRVHNQTLSPPDMKKGDFPRSVTMRGYNHVLVMTNEGCLFELSLSSGKWRTLVEDADFRSYTVISVSPDDRVVALGSITGKLSLIILDQSVEIVNEEPYEGKVFSINWLDEDHLLTCGPDGSLIVWHLDVSDCNGRTDLSSELKEVTRFILLPSKHRWVTGASFSPTGQHIVCGDKGGSVYLYLMEHPVQDIALWPNCFNNCTHGKAGVTFVGCHGDQVYTCGRDGNYQQHDLDEHKITQSKSHKVLKGFDWLERLIFTEDDLLILGFHSSAFIIWSTQRNQRLAQLECGGGHRTWGCEISDGSGVRFVFLKASDIILCETQIARNQTILKGSLHGRELCGIKHLLSTNHKGEKFDVFLTCSEDTNISLSSVAYSANGTSSLSVLQNLKGHISSVRTLAVSETTTCTCDPGASRTAVIFSAGGRAQMKAWKLVVSMATEKEEVTDLFDSISCTSDASSSTSTLSSKGMSEQRKNASITHTTRTLSSDYQLLSSHMLRDPKKMRSKPWKHSRENVTPETRYMHLTAFSGQLVDPSCPSDLHFIGAACSDAIVRFFLFHGGEKRFICLGESSFHNHCVLKVGHFAFRTASTSQTHIILYSCGTGGNIAFWDVTKTVLCASKGFSPSSTDKRHQPHKCDQPITRDREKNTCANIVCPDFESPVYVFTNHQSGVNSVSVRQNKERQEWLMVTGGDDNALVFRTFTEKRQEWLMVTGGDDNALVFRTFTESMDDKGRVHFVPLLKCVLPGAHSAQVTGNSILDDRYVLSVSIDQRLCLWEVTKSDITLKAEMRACKLVSVSDVSDMDVWKQRSGGGYEIAVSGEGLEILQLDVPEQNY